MYSFTFTKKSEKLLNKQEEQFKKRLINKLSLLKSVEDIFLYISKLENMSPYTHRLRIWDMRVLLMLNPDNEKNFYVLHFWKRWDIYK